MASLKYILSFLPFGIDGNSVNAFGRRENIRGEVKLLKKLDSVCTYVAFLIDPISEDPSNRPIAKKYFSKLMTLFKECRISYVLRDEKRKEIKNRKGPVSCDEDEDYDDIKKEIWVHPSNGKRSNVITDITPYVAKKELSKLSHSKINKVFMVSYLHVHGLMFTKNGMEDFEEIALQMLKEFRVLLSTEPLPIPMIRFTQYLELNKFAIQNRRPAERPAEQGFPASVIYKNAIAMSWEMISLIVDKCNRLMIENMATDNGTSFDYLNCAHICFLLQPVQDWCLWLMNEPDVMISSCSDYVLSGTENYWARLATFANTLNKLKVHYNLPLHHLYVKEWNLPDFMDSVNYILCFASGFLCKHDPPIFKVHTNDTGFEEYISLIKKDLFPYNDKEALCHTEIEVKPYYIVLDTGCFIDFFLDINKLILHFSNTTAYSCVLLIPNIVLQELEKKTTSPVAKLALQFLKNIDADFVKYVTTDGKIYDSMSLLKREKIGNNDTILKTCLNICKSYSDNMSEDYNMSVQVANAEEKCALCVREREDLKKIFRNVVLLTNDNNLKLNALSSDIPVKTILEFIYWLNTSNN